MAKQITLVGPGPEFKILVQVYTADITDGSFYDLVKNRIEAEILKFVTTLIETPSVTGVQINLSKV